MAWRRPDGQVGRGGGDGEDVVAVRAQAGGQRPASRCRRRAPAAMSQDPAAVSAAGSRSASSGVARVQVLGAGLDGAEQVAYRFERRVAPRAAPSPGPSGRPDAGQHGGHGALVLGAEVEQVERGAECGGGPDQEGEFGVVGRGEGRRVDAAYGDARRAGRAAGRGGPAR